MKTFTVLHRLLGRPPGEVTNDLISEAISERLAETDDLDWKSQLPEAKGITQTDFPKDIAAMANSGGGTIVYGVEESQKKAAGRRNIDELDEGHERSLRSAAVSAISPPIFGLEIHRVTDNGERAVVIVVPASVDGPHLIYRNDFFGAPIRNDADTVWMKERQIEAMYRARFDEQRHAAEGLTNLYTETATGRDTRGRAWLVAVARPRLPFQAPTRPTRDDARAVLESARSHALRYAGRNGPHPLENIDTRNPRPGLRRWTVVCQDSVAANGENRGRVFTTTLL